MYIYIYIYMHTYIKRRAFSRASASTLSLSSSFRKAATLSCESARLVFWRARNEASPAREGPFFDQENIILIWPSSPANPPDSCTPPK